MVTPDLGEHLRDVGEQLHRFGQHVVAEVDEPADDLAGTLALDTVIAHCTIDNANALTP